MDSRIFQWVSGSIFILLVGLYFYTNESDVDYQQSQSVPDIIEYEPQESDANENSDSSSFSQIKSYLESGDVFYKSGSTEVFGKISSTSLRETAVLQNNGVAARILWTDGVNSSILFQENSNVRVWDEDVEYKGTWFWNSNGTLRVQMEKGAQYTFGI